MVVLVRPAVPADAAEVERLAAAALSELDGERGAAMWFRRDARADPAQLAGLARGTATRTDVSEVLLVGTIDDVVTGMVAGHLATLHDGALLGVLTELYVEPDARSVGVGDQLVVDMMQRFRSAGAVGVDSWALPGARQTKNFYEAHGFTARALIVHHRFED